MTQTEIYKRWQQQQSQFHEIFCGLAAVCCHTPMSWGPGATGSSFLKVDVSLCFQLFALQNLIIIKQTLQISCYMLHVIICFFSLLKSAWFSWPHFLAYNFFQFKQNNKIKKCLFSFVGTLTLPVDNYSLSLSQSVSPGHVLCHLGGLVKLENLVCGGKAQTLKWLFGWCLTPLRRSLMCCQSAVVWLSPKEHKT